MVIPIVLFYLFSFVMVASGVMVITARNPVHSVLFLILAFFNASGLFLLLGAEFLAMILVVVYVGAVAVLFLFVVMMLDINIERMRQGFLHYMPVGVSIALLMLLELILVLYSSSLKLDITRMMVFLNEPINKEITNTQAIGNILYTDYILLFQLAGLVLLVAMIGAISLTHRRREGVKRQNISSQLARKPEEAVTLVKVETGKGIS